MNRSKRLASLLSLLMITALVQGCGGGGGGSGTPGSDSTKVYSVDVSVSGLNGSLQLQNNGADVLTLTADGSYQFNTTLKKDDSYNVTITQQPDHQRCQVNNGSGSVASQDVTGIDISCQATYTIGGTVTGLSSGTLVLQNNGGDNLSLSANSDFTFATPLIQNENYSVTVTTQPDEYHNCTVSNATGTVASADISNITLQCNVNPIGYYNNGSASVKADNNTDPLDISDLQGMINGDRIMLMSVTQQLLYDGTITVSGNQFSGTLVIYKTGAPVTVDNGSGPVAMTVPVSGTVTGGSSLEGQLTAQGAGNGTFTLTYAQSNNEVATPERLMTGFDVDKFTGNYWGTTMFWPGWRNGGFASVPGDSLASVAATNGGLVKDCRYWTDSSLTPLEATALYDAVVNFDYCYYGDVKGNYTGLATLLSNSSSDDTLLMAFTNGKYGFFAEYTIQLY